MTDINKEFGRVFTAHALYHNPQLPVIDKTLQPLSTDQATAKIKALVVESIGKDEVFIDIQEVDNTGKVTKTHLGESYTSYMLARNQLRVEIRSIWNTK